MPYCIVNPGSSPTEQGFAALLGFYPFVTLLADSKLVVA